MYLNSIIWWTKNLIAWSWINNCSTSKNLTLLNMGIIYGYHTYGYFNIEWMDLGYGAYIKF